MAKRPSNAPEVSARRLGTVFNTPGGSSACRLRLVREYAFVGNVQFFFWSKSMNARGFSTKYVEFN